MRGNLILLAMVFMVAGCSFPAPVEDLCQFECGHCEQVKMTCKDETTRLKEGEGALKGFSLPSLPMPTP